MNDLRDLINALDEELIALLVKRRGLSMEVVKRKDREGYPLRDTTREKELLQKLIKSGKKAGLEPTFVTRIFHEIIDDSVRLQQSYLHRLGEKGGESGGSIRVAIQGIEGSFSSLAAARFFANRGVDIGFISKMTFEEVVKAVEDQEADYAMLPVENTTSGNINDVYDALVKSSVAIIGEEKLRVKQNLIGIANVDPLTIEKIFSHPQAAAQCSKFLETMPNAKIEEVSDTALSVQKVRDSGNLEYAAIASEQAASTFGMTVIREDIANNKENFTRFVIASKKPVSVDLRIPAKTSVVLSTAQKPGALVEALMVFNKFGVNMTKIQSRPVAGNPWEEMFYIDFEGNIEDDKVNLMIDELGKNTRYFKVFGSYPANDIEKTSVKNDLPQHIENDEPAVEMIPEIKPPAKVKKKSSPYRLAGRDYKSEDTVIKVKDVLIGGDNFVVIGGPCSVESETQIFECARELKQTNAHILRGGCFKPRTNPYAFMGLGYDGLKFLTDAGKFYDLPVITEVLSINQVEEVAKYSDILQIGARNMQNFSLLIEVGKTHRPVLLKRGLMSSIEELLSAAEYILAQGNRQVILCERGIRTFETATRNTLDLSAIPVLKELTHLPVIVDPSHAVGHRDKVIPLAKAAKVVGAHGVMVEFHPDPDKALSDAQQSMSFSQFDEMMAELNKI